mgnify:CR=1 FL=1
MSGWRRLWKRRRPARYKKGDMGMRMVGKIFGFTAVVIVALCGVFGNAGAEQPKVPEGQKPALVVPNANIDIVYYFMTTQRCPSCMKIESYTKEAVEKPSPPI